MDISLKQEINELQRGDHVTSPRPEARERGSLIHKNHNYMSNELNYEDENYKTQNMIQKPKTYGQLHLFAGYNKLESSPIFELRQTL